MDRDSADPGPFQGLWYFLITLLSLGLLAWVPFAHGAARLRSRARAVEATVYAAFSTLALILFSIAPADAQGDLIGIGRTEVGIGLFTLIGLMAAGGAQQVRLRREAYYQLPAARDPEPVDPAIAAVLAGRAKRQQAREIIAEDPMMAHELRIGRPDLPHRYDDGGLVDLNAASAKAIAQACELDPAVARAIVDARTSTGGFVTVEDVFSLVDVPLSAWPMVRDRGVVITVNGLLGGG